MYEVLPGWMTDGKGLRGDAQAAQDNRIQFPGAQVQNVEPQLSQGSEPEKSDAGGGVLLPQSGVWRVTFAPKGGSGFNLFLDTAGISILLSDPEDENSQIAISNISSALAWNGVDDKIWLEGSGAGMATVAVKSLGNGDSFGGGAVQDDGGSGSPTVYTQTAFRKVVATISSDGGFPAKPQILHLLYANLALETNQMTGSSSKPVSAIYPYAL